MLVPALHQRRLGGGGSEQGPAAVTPIGAGALSPGSLGALSLSLPTPLPPSPLPLALSTWGESSLHPGQLLYEAPLGTAG